MAQEPTNTLPRWVTVFALIAVGIVYLAIFPVSIPFTIWAWKKGHLQEALRD